MGPCVPTSQSMTYPITLCHGLKFETIHSGHRVNWSWPNFEPYCAHLVQMVADKQDSPLKTGVPSSKRSPSCIRAHVEVAFFEFFPLHTMEGCCSPNSWNIHTECVELGCMILLLSILAHSWLPVGAYQTKKDTIFWFPLRRCATPTFFFGFPELAMFQCWRTGPFFQRGYQGWQAPTSETHLPVQRAIPSKLQPQSGDSWTTDSKKSWLQNFNRNRRLLWGCCGSKGWISPNWFGYGWRKSPGFIF